MLKQDAQSKYKGQATFDIIPRDQYGNLLSKDTSLNVNFVVFADAGAAMATVGSAQRQADGSYSASYLENRKSGYDVHVQMGGVDIKGSPYTVTVDSKAGAYAPKCTVSGAFASGITADNDGNQLSVGHIPGCIL